MSVHLIQVLIVVTKTIQWESKFMKTFKYTEVSHSALMSTLTIYDLEFSQEFYRYDAFISFY